MFYGWGPYVPVAQRRAREAARLAKKGRRLSPVVLDGRAITRTFWGTAWCENLERYSYFANRLPRGRTYVRNGSVIDLQIARGAVTALVSGSMIYKITVNIALVVPARWRALGGDGAGAIDSLVELLQGRLAKGVMERLCRERTGLFPAPAEITLACSCQDWASMCKHVAAVLYGVGARLDERPELLFALRGADEKALITQAGAGVALSRKGPAAGKILDDAKLSEVFGIELAAAVPPTADRRRAAARRGPKPPAAPATPPPPGAAGPPPTPPP